MCGGLLKKNQQTHRKMIRLWVGGGGIGGRWSGGIHFLL